MRRMTFTVIEGRGKLITIPAELAGQTVRIVGTRRRGRHGKPEGKRLLLQIDLAPAPTVCDVCGQPATCSGYHVDLCDTCCGHAGDGAETGRPAVN